jgi:hypothetical protein
MEAILATEGSAADSRTGQGQGLASARWGDEGSGETEAQFSVLATDPIPSIRAISIQIREKMERFAAIKLIKISQRVLI